VRAYRLSASSELLQGSFAHHEKSGFVAVVVAEPRADDSPHVVQVVAARFAIVRVVAGAVPCGRALLSAPRAGGSNKPRKLSTCRVTSARVRAAARGSIVRDYVARPAGEQAVGNGAKGTSSARSLPRAIEQGDLMTQVMSQEHVVRATLLRQLGEVDLLQARRPSDVELRASGGVGRRVVAS